MPLLSEHIPVSDWHRIWLPSSMPDTNTLGGTIRVFESSTRKETAGVAAPFNSRHMVLFHQPLLVAAADPTRLSSSCVSHFKEHSKTW